MMTSRSNPKKLISDMYHHVLKIQARKFYFGLVHPQNRKPQTDQTVVAFGE